MQHRKRRKVRDMKLFKKRAGISAAVLGVSAALVLSACGGS
jgi:hypothetical protein